METSSTQLQKIIFVILVILLIAAVGSIGYYFGLQQAGKNVAQPPVNRGVACTMEAKLCPDGSAVGRSGPNCEFEACP